MAGVIFPDLPVWAFVPAVALGSENFLVDQAQLPAPSFPAFWKGICVAFVIVNFCYWPVSIAGYWAYGNAAQDNILSNVSGPPWMLAFAYMLIVVHMVGANQVGMINPKPYILDPNIHSCPPWMLAFAYMLIVVHMIGANQVGVIGPKPYTLHSEPQPSNHIC